MGHEPRRHRTDGVCSAAWRGRTPTFFAKCDALPIPGTDGKIVSVFSPAFGHRENAGNVMIVDLKAGPDDWSAARQISPEVPNLGWTIGSGHGREGFRDPYPLSEDCFLVAQDKSLLVLDGNGNTQEFYRAEKMVHDPRVIRPRPREPVLPLAHRSAEDHRATGPGQRLPRTQHGGGQAAARSRSCWCSKTCPSRAANTACPA